MRLRFSLFFALAALFTGCYYDNEEYLYGGLEPIPCDTASVSYGGTVLSILQRECIGCHGASAPGGGVSLHTYEAVVASASSGKLLGTIQHAAGFSQMPKGGNKLPTCELQQIEAWIHQGSPNN